jgi:hypothetical protein
MYIILEEKKDQERSKVHSPNNNDLQQPDYKITHQRNETETKPKEKTLPTRPTRTQGFVLNQVHAVGSDLCLQTPKA